MCLHDQVPRLRPVTAHSPIAITIRFINETSVVDDPVLIAEIDDDAVILDRRFTKDVARAIDTIGLGTVVDARQLRLVDDTIPAVDLARGIHLLL